MYYFALESDILNDDLFFWVFALPLRPKSDILKDPPSEANSIQSANATTKTSETNHTSRYSETGGRYTKSEDQGYCILKRFRLRKVEGGGRSKDADLFMVKSCAS